MENIRYMISDAAGMVNVESHVLRYWEEELSLEVPRNEMGHRYYTEENLKEFQKIKEWKEQGYQLKAIRTMIQEQKQRVLKVEPKEEVVSNNTVKMEQFQQMMNNIVKKALEENNKALGEVVSSRMEEKVIKEMNYLMREQEEAEEERFRKLDAAIRGQTQKKKRNSAIKKRVTKPSF